MRILAIDIGGSSVKHAEVAVGGERPEVHGLVRTPLPSLKYVDLRQVVRDVVKKRLRSGFSGLGISTSGSVDQLGRVISAGHFDGYENIVWRDELQVDNRTPVVVVNDGRAAAWGEYSASVAQSDTHVHVVIGTGVGGGIVHRGELLMGDSGQAGYIGHLKVTDSATIKCSCGREGHVETLASERGILHLFATEVQQGSGAEAPATLNAILHDPHYSPAILSALNVAGRGLGTGLGAVLNILNPASITVGGGVALALMGAPTPGGSPADAMMNGILEGMEETSHRRTFAAVDCQWGILGNDAGLIGAALLAAHGK